MPRASRNHYSDFFNPSLVAPMAALVTRRRLTHSATNEGLNKYFIKIV